MKYTKVMVMFMVIAFAIFCLTAVAMAQAKETPKAAETPKKAEPAKQPAPPKKQHTPPVTPKLQTLCPVDGKKIDKKFYADHKSNRIYFCCEKCKAEFNKDPEKYVKALEKQGITFELSPNAKKPEPPKTPASKNPEPPKSPAPAPTKGK